MILSIESSCDDSSIAITQIKDASLVFHKKISQDLEHSDFGGVVPELAARLHAIALPKILEECKPYFKNLKAIAVTNEPGLSVSLVEGVSMAKALGIALGLPILPIHHLRGHIYSLFINRPNSIMPLGVLLVSGGHTQLLSVKSYDDIEVLVTTLDDSFGESFDKVAKMLDLGYPGGPIVEEFAAKGAKRFSFTVPMRGSKKLAFSYSGLKNQVRLAISESANLDEQKKADVCYAFQKCAVAHLIDKLKIVLKEHAFEDFAVVGGASANLYLRKEIEGLCYREHMRLHVADLHFCSDNAAMIGRCAIDAYHLGRFAKEISVNPKKSF